MRYINFNGNIFPEHEALLPVTNRSYRYGDGFFESMVMFYKQVPLLEYHFNRITFTAEVIGATLPPKFSMESLHTMLLDLAAVNGGINHARIRLQFYRTGEGYYLPLENALGFSITLDAIDNDRFEAGKGLIAGMRDDAYKGLSMVSDLKNSSAIMYVLGAQMVRKEGWDECILTNQFGQVCEGLNSNVFLVKDDSLLTPTLDSGCVNGIMRSYLLGTYEGQIVERDIEVEELLTADGILITNAVKGVQWIKELNGRHYNGSKAMELTTALNRNLLGLSN